MSSIIDTTGIGGSGGGSAELELIATSPALPDTTAPTANQVLAGQWEIADTDNWQRINTTEYKGIYFVLGGQQSGTFGTDVHPKGTGGYLFVPIDSNDVRHWKAAAFMPLGVPDVSDLFDISIGTAALVTHTELIVQARAQTRYVSNAQRRIIELVLPTTELFPTGTHVEVYYFPGGVAGPRGPGGVAGDDGWSPVLANIADGARVVQQVADWIGGGGSKPTQVGQYVGASGFVTDIADATDIRGPAGQDGSDGQDGQGGGSSTFVGLTDTANALGAVNSLAQVRRRVRAGSWDLSL